MIRVAQRGDIIVIKSIDRLGRNYTEIRDQWQMITQDIGCGIHVLDMPALNTTGDPGDLISRFVTDMILQVLALKRQKEGLKSARKKGSLKIGRPKEYGMSTRTFFRRMRELDSRYGDIPPEKLRDYIVEDDFADGIEFAMERIEDVVGIWNPTPATERRHRKGR